MIDERLTRAERERYWTGDWMSPRCVVCGCLEDNHRTDGTCGVCSCESFTKEQT